MKILCPNSIFFNRALKELNPYILFYKEQTIFTVMEDMRSQAHPRGMVLSALDHSTCSLQNSQHLPGPQALPQCICVIVLCIWMFVQLLTERRASGRIKIWLA